MGKQKKLEWWPDRRMGYYPVVQNGQYGPSYWEGYVKYKTSPIAARLMAARVDIVEKYCGGSFLLDIGIGCGHFIESRGDRGTTYGYDVNPLAIEWLLERKLWWDPFFKDPENVSCWDSLEHMARPKEFIDRVQKFVFLSVPIFKGEGHALKSKHFKPDEHYWYWTEEGLVQWMKGNGFDCLESNRMETELGREDIGTYAFVRKDADS